MLRRQIKVFFVTHMYDLARGFQAQQLDSAFFLRAERRPDGRRRPPPIYLRNGR